VIAWPSISARNAVGGAGRGKGREGVALRAHKTRARGNVTFGRRKASERARLRSSMGERECSSLRREARRAYGEQ